MHVPEVGQSADKGRWNVNIKDLRKHWNAWGETDPFWSILVGPDKRGNRWDIEEFFATGESEIDGLMQYIKSLGLNLPQGKALDFGCGVGRLTQALAHYFDEVHGVDIAPSMIELANKYNSYGYKCKYHLNVTDDLELFTDNSFDFIYSNITLQHMEPRYSKKYIREFLRILAPGGLLIFQLPSEHGTRVRALVFRSIPSVLVNVYRKALNVYRMVRHITSGEPIMEMNWIKQQAVINLLEQSGSTVVDVARDQSRVKDWVSLRYCVEKRMDGWSRTGKGASLIALPEDAAIPQR